MARTKAPERTYAVLKRPDGVEVRVTNATIFHALGERDTRIRVAHDQLERQGRRLAAAEVALDDHELAPLTRLARWLRLPVRFGWVPPHSTAGDLAAETLALVRADLRRPSDESLPGDGRTETGTAPATEVA